MNKRFAVTDHEYFNTGGNCMVSIFTVYDKQKNATRYVLMNEEGFQFATADTIRNDEMFETDEERDATMLGYWSLNDLTMEPCWDQHQFTDEEWELFKYCQFEFYKEDCKYFNRKVHLPAEHLTVELHQQLAAEVIEWHYKNAQLFATDGYTVEPSSFCDVEQVVRLGRELQQIKDFRDWHLTQAADSELYGEHYVISFNGRSVKLPYDADTFNTIDDLLKNTIEEW